MSGGPRPRTPIDIVRYKQRARQLVREIEVQVQSLDRAVEDSRWDSAALVVGLAESHLARVKGIIGTIEQDGEPASSEAVTS